MQCRCIWNREPTGVTVRKRIFISYARTNEQVIRQLDTQIREFGCATWVDTALSGGQHWWDEILRQIADCDAFIATVSRDTLNSEACTREFDWAIALGKPVLPVAVEHISAVPPWIAKLHIVDYSDPEVRDKAAGKLAGGLFNLPPAPPLPEQLPEPPAPPLSYLSNLIELVMQKGALGHDQQHDVLQQLEPALHASDPDERRGGRDILEIFGTRRDLYADVYRRLSSLIDDSARADRNQAPLHPVARPTTTSHAGGRPPPSVHPSPAPVRPKPSPSSVAERPSAPSTRTPPREEQSAGPNRRPVSNAPPHWNAKPSRKLTPANKSRQYWFVALLVIAAVLALCLIFVLLALQHEQSSRTNGSTSTTETELPATQAPVSTLGW